LQSAGEAAIHDTTAFQSMRGYFHVKLLEEMKKSFDPCYAILRDLQINKVRRPEDFETAVKDKEAAKENIKIAENWEWTQRWSTFKLHGRTCCWFIEKRCLYQFKITSTSEIWFIESNKKLFYFFIIIHTHTHTHTHFSISFKNKVCIVFIYMHTQWYTKKRKEKT